MFFTTHITRSRLASALLGLLVATTPLLAADKPLRTPLGKPLPKNGPHTSIEAARGKLRENMQQQIDEFMQLHNDARAEVGAPPLVWDEGIAAYAQEWAEQIAAEDKMEHRPGGKYGENLAGYLPEYGERPVHGAHMWYEEIKDYKGGKMEGDNYRDVGHYTQMVWRKSTRVGFGMAMTKNGMVMLCANYEVAGNMDGEHPYAEDGKDAAPPPPAAAAAPAANDAPAAPNMPAAPALGGGDDIGGMHFRFIADWDTEHEGDTIRSNSDDGSARVIVTKIPLPPDLDSPWDKIQGEMAKTIAPHLPGLTDLEEVSTEHDVFRSGVGMRVVTWTGKLEGKPVDVITDFARENNQDGNGLVLIIRCIAQGNEPQAKAARAVVDSLRFVQ
jgi:pathogenesis-related protein 1